MITHDSVLVQLIGLIERIPSPPPQPPPRRRRGRPVVYSEKLFLKALVIMIVRRLHRVGELLAVLDEPTPEMRMVRELLLCEKGRFPCRRTFERRLKAVPESLPEQIGCLGRHLVEVLKPWQSRGRAVALDSTTLRAKGGVWHKKDREAGVVPHTSIDTEAGWTKSGWHGWVYGWKLHLAICVCEVWIPLAARLIPANTADNKVAPHLIEELPDEARYVLGDIHYNAPNLRQAHAKAPSVFWLPPNEELTRTPIQEWRSEGSSTSCAAWPTRTSMSISRRSSSCTGRFPPKDSSTPNGSPLERCLSTSWLCSTVMIGIWR